MSCRPNASRCPSTPAIQADTLCACASAAARTAAASSALRVCDEVALDGAVARAAGLLCGAAGTADITDASVAVTAAGLARADDVAILTSDRDDIQHLLVTLAVTANIIDV